MKVQREGQRICERGCPIGIGDISEVKEKWRRKGRSLSSPDKPSSPLTEENR